MSGSPGTEISSLNRRRPLKARRTISKMRDIRMVSQACVMCTALLFAHSVFGQANAGPVRITLDEAIQMALQHNHNLLAARTTIQQSEAQEITANLRPNPTLLGDAEYLSPSHPTSDYLSNASEFDLGVSYLFER